MAYTIYIIGIFIIIFILFLMGNGLYAAVTTAPFCPTPKRVIRAALAKAKLKPQERFYDLGAGDGRALLMANKEFGAKACGFELSLFRFLIAKTKIALFASNTRDIQLYWKDLYKQNLEDADVIFVWLTPQAHRRLEAKFARELKSGTRVMTYSSPLEFWKPSSIIQPLPKRGKIYLYYTSENKVIS